MTDAKPTTPGWILRSPFRRSPFRIAGLIAIVLIALSAQYKPSAALPLIAQRIGGHHNAARVTLLLAQLRQNERVGRVMAGGAVVLNDVHSMLTTPKDVPIVATAGTTDFQPLTIRTEVVTHRAFSTVHPLIRFAAGMAPGSNRVARHGQPGITVVTERLTLWNNLVVDRRTMSLVVVQRAKPSIIVAAPRSLAEALAIAGVRKPMAVYAMVATAYTADTAQAVPTGITATGLPAHYGVVAVDPRVIRLGSRLYIEGYGPAIAADTGGAIRGNRIDLCMDSLRRALIWGRQPVKVYLLQE